MFEKKNFRYGDWVRVKNTGCDFDGTQARIVGVSTRGLVDIYICQLLSGRVQRMPPPDNMEYSAFTMPESCLDLVPIVGNVLVVEDFDEKLTSAFEQIKEIEALDKISQADFRHKVATRDPKWINAFVEEFTRRNRERP